jgi:hypothetical protein
MFHEIIKTMILVLHLNQKLPPKIKSSNLERKQYPCESIM